MAANPAHDSDDVIDVRPLPAIRAEMGLVRDPDEAIRDATRAATAIARVIDAKPNPVELGGKRYLELEDWIMLGEWYGVTVQVESDRRVIDRIEMEPDTDDGGLLRRFRPRPHRVVRGWEATAIVVDKATGNIVGRANAMCLDDEDTWNTRPRYEWHDADDPDVDPAAIVDRGTFERRNAMVDRVKVHVADDPVPDFMRRSMAQTRASSKALSLRLRWIPVLAGTNLAAGVAEEVNTPAAEIPPRRGVRARVAAAERAAPARRPSPRATAGPAVPASDPKTWLPDRDRKILDDTRNRANATDLARAEQWLKDNGYRNWGDFYMRGNPDHANLAGIILNGGTVTTPAPAPEQSAGPGGPFADAPPVDEPRPDDTDTDDVRVVEGSK